MGKEKFELEEKYGEAEYLMRDQKHWDKVGIVIERTEVGKQE